MDALFLTTPGHISRVSYTHDRARGLPSLTACHRRSDFSSSFFFGGSVFLLVTAPLVDVLYSIGIDFSFFARGALKQNDGDPRNSKNFSSINGAAAKQCQTHSIAASGHCVEFTLLKKKKSAVWRFLKGRLCNLWLHGPEEAVTTTCKEKKKEMTKKVLFFLLFHSETFVVKRPRPQGSFVFMLQQSQRMGQPFWKNKDSKCYRPLNGKLGVWPAKRTTAINNKTNEKFRDCSSR